MIGFRVDANEKIATGHLMRCMTIATECMRQGEKCVFFLAEDKETGRLKEKRIPYRILHAKWDELDAEKTVMNQLIAEEKLDWLVVDSYQATVPYLAYLEQFVPVLYIDDMGEALYPVSAVLHYGQWAEETDYQKKYAGLETIVLVGMQYTPLREEFSIIAQNNLEDGLKSHREKSILITTGGTDPYNVTGKLLEACIAREEFNFYKFDVIVGNMNENEDELRQMAENNSRIDLHKNIKNMAEYMGKCEMAVSAGGTTLFELCACRIPTVCFSFADNQKPLVQEMGRREIMRLAGDAREEILIAEKICEQLIFLKKNENIKRQYIHNMSRLVDGQGVARIVDFLMGKRNVK